MSSNKIYPLICLLVFSITTAYGAGDEDPLYKILKIKTQGGVLCVIHAQRNDSLFKIISKIVSLDKKPDLEQLRKGKSYYFDFGRTNHDTTKVEAVPLSGSASYLHVKNSRFFNDGKTKIKFEKRFHYRIYTTRNLIGLYCSRWPG